MFGALRQRIRCWRGIHEREVASVRKGSTGRVVGMCAHCGTRLERKSKGDWQPS